MNAKITLTLIGDIPDKPQIGDELQITGTITIHSITADLVDVSSGRKRSYLPGAPDIEAYANDINLTRP